MKAAHIKRIRERVSLARRLLLPGLPEVYEVGGQVQNVEEARLAQVIARISGIKRSTLKNVTSQVWRLLTEDIDDLCNALIAANQENQQLRREVHMLREIVGEAGLMDVAYQAPPPPPPPKQPIVECPHLLTPETCAICTRLRVDEVMLRELAREGMDAYPAELDGYPNDGWGPWITSQYGPNRCRACLNHINFGDRTRYSGPAGGFVCAACGKDGDPFKGDVVPVDALAKRHRVEYEMDELALGRRPRESDSTEEE